MATSSGRLPSAAIAPRDDDVKVPVRLGWRRGLVVVALFIAILVFAQTCQKAQIRLTKQQAVATALKQVDFRPTQTQVRLVRQGINSRPFWAVSLSIPIGPERYSRLTVVRVDANTGKVAGTTRQVGP